MPDNSRESGMPTVEILGLPISSLTMSDVIDAMHRSVINGTRCTIFPVNVDVVMKAQEDDEFRSVLCGATLLPPDGMPIVWASKFLRNPVAEKVTGSVLFEAFCESIVSRPYRIFLLGGMEGIANRAGKALKSRFPNLNIAGCYSPPWNFEHDEDENSRIVRMINELMSDILVVGLGAPKQEKWIAKHMGQINAKLFLAVGGSFDYYSGAVRRPPRFLSQIGLEWCWRISQDPRRLWKRYLVDDPPFFYHVLRQRFGRYERPR